jgi:hypothetical protein
LGFINRLAGPLRRAFSYNKDQQNSILAKGSLYPPNLPGGILSGYDGQGITDSLRLDYDLLSAYADYEGMDNYDLISSALDILANDVTQLDYSNGKCMWTTSKDENIKIVLDDLWHKTLRIEEEAWEIARTMVKMGNNYEEILVNDKGVCGLNFLDPKTIRRIEGPYGNLVGFVQDFSGKTGYTPEEYERVLQASRGRDKTSKFEMNMAITALEPWEVTHFRLRSKNRRSAYGVSQMDGARWVWKRLMLLEDAATVFRVQRAPERYAFYVDVGDLPAKEALAYLNQVRSMHKKKKMIDPQTGKMSLRWEAISPEEDMYIPVRKGVQGARVEVLQSPAWQSTEDLNYFQDKLFGAMKVPKSYLAHEAGVAKASLSSQDVNFAKTVLRIQREMKNGFKKVARTHLAALGIDPYDVDYDLKMTVPSAIFELAQQEVRVARADLANRMKADVSQYWLLSNVYSLSDDEIKNIFLQQKEDIERQAKNQAAAQSAMAPPGGGMPMGPPGGAPGMPMGASGAPMGPPPGAGQPQAPVSPEQAAQMPPAAQESLRLTGLRTPGYGRMTEQQLFAGNREHEKRLEDKFDKMLQSDKLTQHRLMEIGQLLGELRSASKR